MIDDTPDTQAAELALGVLDGDERAVALRRVLAEPAFAAEVDRWRTEFGALFDAVPTAVPGPALFDRIQRSLDGRPAPARRSWVWPSLAGISSVAAAALLAVVVTRAPTPSPVNAAPTSILAAAITPTGTGAPITAVYEPRTGTVRLSAATLADARHSAELWVIGADGVPYSLGLLRDGATTAMRVAPVDRRRLAATVVLAVSLEPLGGSPTGKPTGPVVAKGTLNVT